MFIFALILNAIVWSTPVYQLQSGIVLTRSGRPWFSREQRPTEYWWVIAIHVATALGLAYFALQLP